MAKQCAIKHRGAIERPLSRIGPDTGGAVLIEAAAALSILIVLLAGIVTYGLWLTAAATLQQVANEAARATLGALDADERDHLAHRAIVHSLLRGRLIDAEKVAIDTSAGDGFYTVTLTYDTSAAALFSNSIVPLPDAAITRTASVEISAW